MNVPIPSRLAEQSYLVYHSSPLLYYPTFPPKDQIIVTYVSTGGKYRTHTVFCMYVSWKIKNRKKKLKLKKWWWLLDRNNKRKKYNKIIMNRRSKVIVNEEEIKWK